MARQMAAAGVMFEETVHFAQFLKREGQTEVDDFVVAVARAGGGHPEVNERNVNRAQPDDLRRAFLAWN